MSIPDPQIQAEILAQALPYIQRWHGRAIVIKYGGAAMTDDDLCGKVMQDIVLMQFVGIRPIVVHGGGPEINEAMKKLGKAPVFHNGLRVTDAETMEIVEMVLSGKTNKRLVGEIGRIGGKAVGLSGKDGLTILARQLSSELGLVGEVLRVDAGLLEVLTNSGYIPVVSTIAAGESGETYNLNADHAAGSVAAAIGAAKLIVLTDVPGVLSDPDDPMSLITEFSRDEAARVVAEGHAKGGMIPKIEACLTALDGGVERAHIIDGRAPRSLLIECFTDHGIGTMVR